MSKMCTEPSNVSHLHGCTFSGDTMGTRYSARLFAEPIDQTLVGAALFAAVDAVDRQMSTRKPDSDLSRLNAAPVGHWVPVPAGLAIVLAEAVRIGRDSGGAFDIGVGDLVNDWGFGPTEPCHDPARRAAASGRRRLSAMDSLEFDEAGECVRKLAPVTLDLSGIAKGFGVDELARCLERFGIASYLVGIDGELRVRGSKPGGEPWTVAVERPDFEKRDVMGVLALSDTAVATSGDYRHWIEFKGAKLSHTMDPRTGEPLRNRIASVTVLAKQCVDADAWATALMVMGDSGPDFARARGMDALFVMRDSDRLTEVGTGKFESDV
jgi:thiamine biosynthesis lipoprotein